MDLFIQRVLDGLGSGAIFSALGLAIVLVYMSTGTINLAQGAMGMFCTFIAWKLSSPTGLGWPLGVAIIIAIVAGMASGALLERVFVRPLESETNHLPVIIVTLGLLLGIEALAGKIFTLSTVQLGSPFPAGAISVGSVRIQDSTVGLIGVVLAATVLIRLLFQKTRLGLAMRAAVDNPESSQLVGIRRSNMHMVGWALAGGLGALAGVLIAPTTLVYTSMLDSALFFGFAAAAVGGFRSPFGAVVGGFIIGLVQSLAPAYVPLMSDQLSIVAVFVVMIAILLLRPSGLFGRADVVRL